MPGLHADVLQCLLHAEQAHACGGACAQILLSRAAQDFPKQAPPPLRFIRSCSSSLAAPTLHKLEATFGVPVLEVRLTWQWLLHVPCHQTAMHCPHVCVVFAAAKQDACQHHRQAEAGMLLASEFLAWREQQQSVPRRGMAGNVPLGHTLTLPHVRRPTQ